MESKYVSKGTIKITGFSCKTTAKNGQNFRDIPLFWSDYIKNGRMEKLHRENIKNHDEYGICASENSETGDIEYIIGVEINDDKEIPAGYTYFEIPPSKYAVFSTEPSNENNFTHNIQKLWGYIFSE
jgi:AraC family transcriptional regulator